MGQVADFGQANIQHLIAAGLSVMPAAPPPALTTILQYDHG